MNERNLPGVWDGDGVISCHDDLDEYVDLIRASDVPAVDIGWRRERLQLPWVKPDNHRIGELGAAFFLRRGFEHLAFVHRALVGVNSPERAEGFVARCREGGVAAKPVRADDFARALPSLPRPLGVMAAGDELAVQACYACAEAGLDVPGDVSILGVDNDPSYTMMPDVTLSSIDIDLDACGYEAARLLADCMEGECDECRVVPPKGIVERGSTLAPVTDQRVKTALQYILNKLSDPELDPDQVASHIALTRRHLDSLFEQNRLRTIHGEIIGARLTKAARMLRETTDKVTSVSHACGFTNSRQLSRAFASSFGMSPGEFRRSIGDGPS